MEHVIQAIPASCSRCGAFFDLRYDLEPLSDERSFFEAIAALRTGMRAKLCWKCREY